MAKLCELRAPATEVVAVLVAHESDAGAATVPVATDVAVAATWAWVAVAAVVACPIVAGVDSGTCE